MVELGNDWQDLLAGQFAAGYYLSLRQFLIGEYRQRTIYPDKYDIFNALRATAYSQVKAVILGQDPYHGPGQAHGLSFSVQPQVVPPPSLQNIFLELRDDLACRIPNHGCLNQWARQGVLLLNTVLTVRAGQPNSHRGRGWEIFTDYIIDILNRREEPMAFILWGRHAQAKAGRIDNQRHLVICSPHPSPLSARAGFFGSRPFSRVNGFLRACGQDEINWQIDDLPQGGIDDATNQAQTVVPVPGNALSQPRPVRCLSDSTRRPGDANGLSASGEGVSHDCA